MYNVTLSMYNNHKLCRCAFEWRQETTVEKWAWLSLESYKFQPNWLNIKFFQKTVISARIYSAGVGTLPCQPCQAGKFLASLARQACLACLANEIPLASFWQVLEFTLYFPQIFLKGGSRTIFLTDFVDFNHIFPQNSRILTKKIFLF